MYEFCTAEPKKIASILRFLPFGPVGAPPGLSFNGFRPASYPVSSVFGAASGQGEAALWLHGFGAAALRLRLFRDRRVGPGYPVPAFGCGIGRGSPLRRSGRGVSVAGFRVRGCFGCGIGRGSPLRRSGRGVSVAGSRVAAVRLRRWSGLSIEALQSRRVGRRVPGPRRSGYSFSVWGSSLTETSRVLFSRSACGRGLLVHSSQSRRRCVMSMAA